jgi:hypothetical protein
MGGSERGVRHREPETMMSRTEQVIAACGQSPRKQTAKLSASGQTRVLAAPTIILQKRDCRVGQSNRREPLSPLSPPIGRPVRDSDEAQRLQKHFCYGGEQ